MKKRLFVVLAIAVLLLCLAVPAAAQETELYVYDVDDYLTAEEWEQLEIDAEAVSERYAFGVYIAVFDDMGAYGIYDIEEFSEEVYKEWELGYDTAGNGILLVLSMADRDYDLVAYGDFGNYAFTDYGKDVLADTFLDDFRYDHWYEGFRDYIGGCASLLEAAGNGEPVDVSYGSYEPTRSVPLAEKVGSSLVPALIVGVIAALIYCSILKSRMKTAVAATEASRYVAEYGVNMLVQDDIFTHSTVVRQHIDRDSGSRSHGGGTSVNSGGFSHHSGKF